MTNTLTPHVPLRVLLRICLERISAPGVAAALTPPVPICSVPGAVRVVVATGSTIVTVNVRASDRLDETSKKFPDH